MISGKAKNIKNTFDKLLENNHDIKGIILLSYEGLVMVSTLATGNLEDTISAMAAGINTFIPRFLKEIQWSSFSNTLITGSKSLEKSKVEEYILIKEIKKIGLIVVITRSNVDWEKIHSHVNYAIATIGALDENPPL